MSKKLKDESEALRLKEINTKLSQQTIIEFAYAIHMMVEPLAESGSKLSFEEANCLTSLFYCIRRLLGYVDQKYLDLHPEVVNFYRKDRELDNSCDRLSWQKAEQNSKELEDEE